MPSNHLVHISFVLEIAIRGEKRYKLMGGFTEFTECSLMNNLKPKMCFDKRGIPRPNDQKNRKITPFILDVDETLSKIFSWSPIHAVIFLASSFQQFLSYCLRQFLDIVQNYILPKTNHFLFSKNNPDIWIKT